MGDGWPRVTGIVVAGRIGWQPRLKRLLAAGRAAKDICRWRLRADRRRRGRRRRHESTRGADMDELHWKICGCPLRPRRQKRPMPMVNIEPMTAPVEVPNRFAVSGIEGGIGGSPGIQMGGLNGPSRPIAPAEGEAALDQAADDFPGHFKVPIPTPGAAHALEH